MTDRPVDRSAMDWPTTTSDQFNRHPLREPNLLWDATLGKDIDQRTYFGRGGNGIFGQPLVSETL